MSGKSSLLHEQEESEIASTSQSEIEECIKQLLCFGIGPRFECEQNANGSFVLKNGFSEVYLRDAKELRAFVQELGQELREAPTL